MGETASPVQISLNTSEGTSFSGGGDDAFLLKITQSGQPLWCRYFGGSGSDYGTGVTSAGNGPIICGFTSSTNGIAFNSPYQTDNAGGDDNFIASFTPEGNLDWGTYSGGSSFDFSSFVGSGLTTDSSNIYFTGTTQSSTGLAYGNDPYQSELDPADTLAFQDGYVSSFSLDGTCNWSTYYGGSSSDNMSSICLLNSHTLLISGDTYSGDLATPNAYLDSLITSPNSSSFSSGSFITQMTFGTIRYKGSWKPTK